MNILLLLMVRFYEGLQKKRALHVEKKKEVIPLKFCFIVFCIKSGKKGVDQLLTRML